MRKFDNFTRALENMKEIYDYEEPLGNVEITGLVGLFEICFEQAWKVMKECLENSGFDQGRTGSPKQILKTAYSAGMIDDEGLWLDALIARNNVSYSYNRDIALSIVQRAKADFYPLFCSLRKELEENWL